MGRNHISATSVVMLSYREETISMYIYDKAFLKKSDLVRHTLQHSGEKQFQCNYCDIAFLRKEHLLKHKIQHTGKKPFQCISGIKLF